ncbi:hypothetical protein [Actinomadura atramentaria]|uniref:hypothetical protein n=1 Tax=Actinomadura atramentaria TaxID=1990 RepID=UPI000687FA00|nr:hypothetical protein [Actinomadura atramentaria]
MASDLLSQFGQHPVPAAVVAASAVALVALVAVAVRRGVRAGARAVRAHRARRASASSAARQGADGPAVTAWTLLGAAIATVVAAEGMWETFSSPGMHMSPLIRIATFAFIEVAVVGAALRARQSMRESYAPGVDGIAMWVLTGTSALLSASHAIGEDDPSAGVILIRLCAPLIAAWGWERTMRLERRRRTGRTGAIHWRITPERILVRLGLADPTAQETPEVAARRYLMQAARAAGRARELTGKDRRQRTALRRLSRALGRAMEHANLATDPARQDEFLGALGVVYNAAGVLQVQPRAPWDPQPQRPADGGLRADVPVRDALRTVAGYGVPALRSDRAGRIAREGAVRLPLASLRDTDSVSPRVIESLTPGVPDLIRDQIPDQPRAVIPPQRDGGRSGETESARVADQIRDQIPGRAAAPESPTPDVPESQAPVIPPQMTEEMVAERDMLLALPSAAARVRAAMDALSADGTEPSPSLVVAWLGARWLPVTLGYARTAMRRARRMASGDEHDQGQGQDERGDGRQGDAVQDAGSSRLIRA